MAGSKDTTMAHDLLSAISELFRYLAFGNGFGVDYLYLKYLPRRIESRVTIQT